MAQTLAAIADRAETDALETAAAGTAERSVTQDTAWFATWFDSAHYHTLYADRDETEAAGFVDALTRRLRPAGGARALDVGCGAGRHARQLASHGFRVTGIDLAAGSIAQAKRSERPGLRFVRHDMRVPFGPEAFDFVFNFFTSFGYFDGLAEHLTVIGNMTRALKTGGTLVLDYVNVRDAERRLTPNEVKTIDGTMYQLTRWSDADHFYKRIAIDDGRGGAPLDYVERVAKFSLQDFRHMFAVYGLRIDDVYGDYRLGPYDVGASPRLILVAKKTATPTPMR
jgi:SAM-dependent methyltransferase